MNKMRMAILVTLCCGTLGMGIPTPTAYISFEDTTFGGATYVNDQIGRRTNGSTAGPVYGEINTVSGGPVGKYGEFNTNAWLYHGGDSLQVAHPGANGTIAMWVRIDQVNQPDFQHNDYFVSTTNPILWTANPGSNTQGWKCYTASSTGNLVITTRLDSNYWTTTAGSIAASEIADWFHYAITWELNGAGTHLDTVMYLNGVPVSASTEFYDAYASMITIGGATGSLWHSSWTGDLDEVYVFDQALDAAEVSYFMSIPEPATMLLLAFGGVMLRYRK